MKDFSEKLAEGFSDGIRPKLENIAEQFVEDAEPILGAVLNKQQIEHFGWLIIERIIRDRLRRFKNKGY